MDGREEPADIVHDSLAGSRRRDDEAHEIGVIGMLGCAVEHADVRQGVTASGEGGEEEHVAHFGLRGDADGLLKERRELAGGYVGREEEVVGGDLEWGHEVRD